MLLLLEEDLKKKLDIFSNLDSNVVRELCLTGLQFITNGINNRFYSNVSNKLNINEDTIRESIETLMFVVTQSSKLSLSEIDFKDSLMTLGLSEELQNQLVNWYSTNKQNVRQVLSQMDSRSSGSLRYSSLEWRFQCQMACRSARDQLKPQIILKFELLGQNSEKKFVTLVCDVSNLIHIHDVLEEALISSRTQHLLKTVRPFK